MIYLPHDLEALRGRVDLVALISKYVELAPAGPVMKGFCPFHFDVMRNLTVGKDSYHCYTCGAHGEAVSFLMDHCKMNFHQAVQELCRISGVELKPSKIPCQEGICDKVRTKTLLLDASKIFEYFLKNSTQGTNCRAVIEHLLHDETVEKSAIGFSPSPHTNTVNCLIERGYSVEEIAKIVCPFSVLEDSLIIPIRNGPGEILGFYGIQNITGKWAVWASPDSCVFSKSRHLFGMDMSRRRIAKEQRAVLVGDPYTALALIEKGLDICVSLVMNELCEGHMRELVNLGVREITVLQGVNDGCFHPRTAMAKLMASMHVECRFTDRLSTPVAYHLRDGGIRSILDAVNGAKILNHV